METTWEKTPHWVGLTDQKNARLIVRDLAVEDWRRDGAVVWEYKEPRTRACAGIKFRNSPLFGGEVVLFCGPEGAGILSFKTKEMLYFTTKVGVNPHAVELLPDGTFLVGSTTDGKVCVFAAAKGDEEPVQTFSYENIHGALWDPKYGVVWMAGRTKLSAFSVTGDAENPHLSPLPEKVYTTGDWLHDLVPCYGDPKSLFVTCGTGIFRFDKEAGQFTDSYPCADLAAGINTSPAAGAFPDGVMALMQVISGQTVYREWCMNQVTVLVPQDDGTAKKIIRIAPDDAYYKVRVCSFDYQ